MFIYKLEAFCKMFSLIFPISEPNNVISILISSDFLKMDSLVSNTISQWIYLGIKSE